MYFAEDVTSYDSCEDSDDDSDADSDEYEDVEDEDNSSKPSKLKTYKLETPVKHNMEDLSG